MSIATEHLGQRLIEPTATAGLPRATLASLTRGQRGVIHDVCDQADPATARRLFDLGFAPGVEVEMLRRHRWPTRSSSASRATTSRCAAPRRAASRSRPPRDRRAPRARRTRPGAGGAATLELTRIALVGSPNSGKTTLFNALTGLRAKTGNYPGVTVSRYEGLAHVGGRRRPGRGPAGHLQPRRDQPRRADRHRRPRPRRPDDPDTRRPHRHPRRHHAAPLAGHAGSGAADRPAGLRRADLHRRARPPPGRARRRRRSRRALGVPVVAVMGGRRQMLGELRGLLDAPQRVEPPVVAPPTKPREVTSWIDSVLTTAGYRLPQVDERTRRIDAVLLHPVWGTLVFFATMFAFFQVIFAVAAPLQGSSRASSASSATRSTPMSRSAGWPASSPTR